MSTGEVVSERMTANVCRVEPYRTKRIYTIVKIESYVTRYRTYIVVVGAFNGAFFKEVHGHKVYLLVDETFRVGLFPEL